ncbi:hypothetical protein KGF54_003867 [Candida jiufengensis]|uniref:uncharacterized protein n=1 Tax=Candida jiufengensis TaxID=497108 RepID=UPI002224CB6F|nr:uncharacterized protein KGF54_003867 [Candida jiufengensis]KAI5950793.1 hypothetical protein KGF54_003867 [Candida jiufengensis]
MSAPTLGHYQTLGVNPSTPFEDIKKAYRKLSLKYHPDKTPDKTHHEKFKEINAAYEIIRTNRESGNAFINVNTRSTSNMNNTRSNFTTFFSQATSSFPFSEYRSTNGSSTHYYSRYTQSSSTNSSSKNNTPNTNTKTKTNNNGGNTDNTSNYSSYNFYQKSQEHQRNAAEAAARHAERLKEEMAERVRAEAASIRRAEAELRRRAEESRIRQDLKREAEEKARSSSRNKDNLKVHFSEEEVLILPSDEEEYVPQVPRKNSSSKTSSKKSDKAYQSAKEKRRNLEESAEIANDFIKENYGVQDETEKYYQNSKKKKKVEIEEEDYNPREASSSTSKPSSSTPSKKGKDSDHPIVLEEDLSFAEEGLSEENNDSFMNVPEPNNQNSFENNEPGQSSGEYDPRILNEHIHFNVKPKMPPRSNTASPTRSNKTIPTLQTQPNHVRFHPTAPHKRSKISSQNPAFGSPLDMNGFDIKVGDIEEVNFNEIYESLPDDQKRKTPKSDEASNISSSSGQKTFDYTNGKSKADILSNPLNKNPVRGYTSTSSSETTTTSSTKKLNILDLHASPKVHNFTAPNPPSMIFNPETMTRLRWQRYVNSLEDYQKAFLSYKEAIVRYQMERTEKDIQFFNEINDENDNENMEVYKQCLARDLEVVGQFKASLRVFSQIMTLYQQNRNWINMYKNWD